jgi:hypothetical protein
VTSRSNHEAHEEHEGGIFSRCPNPAGVLLCHV